MFLALFFLVTYITGRLLEKIRIPWLFSALILGFLLSIYNPVPDVITSPAFLFLAELGMLFLLFIIGFELDISKIFSHERFIVRCAVAVILTESLAGSLLMHYLFGLDWFLSLVVATSFATVGEAVLLPILDEFRLTNTNVGRSILGVGILDDVVEIGIIIIVTALLSESAGHADINIWGTVLLLLFAIFLVFLLVRFHRQIHVFKFKDIPSFFLLVLFFIFLFVALGRFVEAESLGAILAGIALRNILSDNNLKYIDSEIRTMAYGFLAPIFFLWVGVNTDFSYLSASLPLVIIVVAATAAAKITATYLTARKELGSKKSIIVGVGLTVKLSTSIVILKLLLDQGIIGSDVYSVLIASSIIFAIIVPVLLPYLIRRWKIHLINDDV